MFRQIILVAIIVSAYSLIVIGGPIPNTNSTITINVTNSTTNSSRSNEVESHFYYLMQLFQYMTPGSASKEIKGAIKGNDGNWIRCLLCSNSISLIELYPSVITVEAVFNFICSKLYEEQHVCNGISSLFGEQFVYILTHSELSNSEICGYVIGDSCMSSSSNYPWGDKWKYPMLPINTTVRQALEDAQLRNRAEKNVSTILQLTDIHLDMNFQYRAVANCKEPLCCQEGSTPKSVSYPAGMWGSMGNCDSVLRTVNNLAHAIGNLSDQYRYVVFSGDYISHDVWKTSKAQVINTTRVLNQLFRKSIPKDKIVLPLIGNHEGHPVDQFCPPSLGVEKYSSAWLYDELLDQWSDWIPKDYHDTFKKFGYYSLTDNKARFIVLNMNYCARLNFWNVYRNIDQGGMLSWLQAELQKAALADQFVYIVGHIAPDTSECITNWVIAYNGILDQYANIIRAQFFGHTHFDEIRLFYKNQVKPISVAYLAPSVTTFCDVNPAFRLYSADPDTGVIVDHMTYKFNITKANQIEKSFNPFGKPEPKWEFEYSAREAYNLTSLSPQSWNDFFTNIGAHSDLLDKYYQYYGRYSQAKADSTSRTNKLSNVERVFVRF